MNDKVIVVEKVFELDSAEIVCRELPALSLTRCFCGQMYHEGELRIDTINSDDAVIMPCCGRRLFLLLDIRACEATTVLPVGPFPPEWGISADRVRTRIEELKSNE